MAALRRVPAAIAAGRKWRDLVCRCTGMVECGELVFLMHQYVLFCRQLDLLCQVYKGDQGCGHWLSAVPCWTMCSRRCFGHCCESKCAWRGQLVYKAMQRAVRANRVAEESGAQEQQ